MYNGGFTRGYVAFRKSNASSGSRAIKPSMSPGQASALVGWQGISVENVLLPAQRLLIIVTRSLSSLEMATCKSFRKLLSSASVDFESHIRKESRSDCGDDRRTLTVRMAKFKIQK